MKAIGRGPLPEAVGKNAEVVKKSLPYPATTVCRVADGKMVARYNFFVLEVYKAWIDPARRNPHTIHHLGRGAFAVDGETIRLPSKMK